MGNIEIHINENRISLKSDYFVIIFIKNTIPILKIKKCKWTLLKLEERNKPKKWNAEK